MPVRCGRARRANRAPVDRRCPPRSASPPPPRSSCARARRAEPRRARSPGTGARGRGGGRRSSSRRQAEGFHGLHHAEALAMAARGEEIVEPHPYPHGDEPARGVAVHGHQEGQRADEMGGETLQDLLLAEGLAHELEVEELEIAQAAVDQLGGLRGGAGGEVSLLEQGDGSAAQGEVARYPGAGHAAADHDGVEARGVDSVQAGHAISSRTDRRTWSGASAAIRGSSERVTPESTRMVASPSCLPMAMSVSTRSPTITDSWATQPSARRATSRMMGEGLPTMVSTLVSVTASTAAIMPAQSGISPPSTGHVRSGLVAMRRAPPRTAWSAVLSLA